MNAARPPLTLRELARSKNSVVLVLTIVAILLFAGGLWYVSDYLWHVAQGPEPVTMTQLSRMGKEGVDRWFDVTAEVRPVQVLQTISKTRRGGTLTTNHFVLIRDKAIMVETSRNELPQRFLAWSGEFDENNNYYQRARRVLNQGGASRIPLAPLLLRTSGDVTSTRSVVATVISVVALGLLIMLWRTIRAMRDFTRTAPIARLRKSVRASEGVPALAAEIDRQLAALDPNARRTGPILLPTWLVNVSQNSFSLMSSSDVVWVAPYTITQKLFSIIPTSKKQVVLVVSRTRQAVAFQVPDGRLQEVMTIFHHWAPWAVIGPDAAMETRFLKTRGLKSIWALFSPKPSRAELVAAVDRRRDQMLAMRAAPAAAAPSA
jgi:hypothetical protein